MPKVKIGGFVAGDREIRQILRDLGKRAQPAAAEALYMEAVVIMARSKRRVPVDLGALRSSGHVKPPVIGKRNVTVTMGYGGTAAPYAIYVHEGTGPAAGQAPYFPPVAALKPWARRVLGDERAAYPVARAISRRGTKPTKFLEIPFREAIPGMNRRIAARLQVSLIRPTAVRKATGPSATRSGIPRQAYKGHTRRRLYYPYLRGG